MQLQCQRASLTSAFQAVSGVVPSRTTKDILKNVKGSSPEVEVILITGHASAETAVSAMKEGAYDYITKPLNLEELRLILAKAVEKRQLLFSGADIALNFVHPVLAGGYALAACQQVNLDLFQV